MASEQIPMLPMDREVFKERVKALSDEEVQIVLRSPRITDELLEAELNRRDIARSNIIDCIFALCEKFKEAATREEVNNIIREIKGRE